VNSPGGQHTKISNVATTFDPRKMLTLVLRVGGDTHKVRKRNKVSMLWSGVEL